ncbi:pirin family protein [Natronorubrum sp. JWXQ-INN-674]|uniref:Pirin family protein n=1 Tax=Natronorubrum halalkaliphilum TaxID=2691917 RepID=A0A6B0VTS3_9EURY|nr:pirin family protein [Natronorubrum halalkaliphilum]MXV64497.1 pirin family protein [Natronorubrum halalkaliphilum]
MVPDVSDSRPHSSLDIHDVADVTHAGGMRATRAFPTGTHAHFDPFVLFERFHVAADQGFPSHAHAGFEILTYMLEGGMAHDDSLGHDVTTRAGEAMRITAGDGIRHSEFPADGPCSGLQLWVNLPRDRKGIEPSYADASSDELPTETGDGVSITTVVGEGAPLDLETPMQYRDVTLSAGASWTWNRPEDWVGFCYVVSGSGTVDGTALEVGQFCTVDADGASVTLSTEDRCRVVVVDGVPHDEAIHQRGPIVA